MIGESMSEKEIVFCKSGGCTAKLGAGVLEHILERLPKGKKDENLLVGYDSKDDAAVYRLNERQAVVQTLDFFPPMVEDPYIFGKIAATNALSDIYAEKRLKIRRKALSSTAVLRLEHSMKMEILIDQSWRFFMPVRVWRMPYLQR